MTVAHLDYSAAACLGHDPAMWDNYGTPAAHQICRACPIRTRCAADAATEHATDQVRGGVVFTRRGTPRVEQVERKRARRTPTQSKATTVQTSDLDRALAATQTVYAVAADALLGRARARAYADARAVSWWVLAAHGYSQSSIARAFDRNHTTVWSGLQRVNRTPGLLASAECVQRQFLLRKVAA